MKIDAKDATIESLFKGKQFIIPEYQREYSWEIDDITALWEDFLDVVQKEKSSFFIGPMVYQGKSISDTTFHVIDGQQRLTTIAIFMRAIIAHFESLHCQDPANGLKTYLISTNKENQPQATLHTEQPYPYFQEAILHGDNQKLPKKESEKRIKKAYDIIHEKISEYLATKKDGKQALIELRDALLATEAVIIVSQNEEDAFMVFETINARGKNLTSLDLLKNYLFRLFHPQKVGIREPKDSWDELKANINHMEDDSFFNRFWASYVEKVNENRLYERFQKNMRSKKPIFADEEKLLEALITSSRLYKKITAPQLDDWKINKNFAVYESLKSLIGTFKIKVHIPFVMALLEEYDQKNITITALKKTLQNMENFHFVYTHIISGRASGLDKKYSKYATQLREAKNKAEVLQSLTGDLLEKMKEAKGYIDAFKKLTYSKNKDAITYVLKRFEAEKNPDANLSMDSLSIDHLAPKSKSAPSYDTIGNLILLEKNINTAKDTEDLFAQQLTKKLLIEDLITHTSYLTTRDTLIAIKNVNKWDTIAIEERTSALAQESHDYFITNTTYP